MADTESGAQVAQIFISDLHLAPSRPEIVRLFESFLHGPATEAEGLYILGDLFEYWAGDDDLEDPFNRRVMQAIDTCASRGTRIHFMRGNRDFLVGDAFALAGNLTLLDDPMRAELADGPALLSHGDQLCTDDREYQAFRERVRSKAWITEFLGRPLDERKAEIEALRRRSEAEKRVKSMAIMDVSERAVIETFRHHGLTRLIHGHTHRPAHHRLVVDGVDCERWVLADWYDRGSYLLSDASGTRSLPWPAGNA